MIPLGPPGSPPTVVDGGLDGDMVIGGSAISGDQLRIIDGEQPKRRDLYPWLVYFDGCGGAVLTPTTVGRTLGGVRFVARSMAMEESDC